MSGMTERAKGSPVTHGRWIMRGGRFRCSVCDDKARWIMRGGRFRCSVCDDKARWICAGGTGGWTWEYVQDKSPYCPSCGAKMDVELGVGVTPK